MEELGMVDMVLTSPHSDPVTWPCTLTLRDTAQGFSTNILWNQLWIYCFDDFYEIRAIRYVAEVDAHTNAQG
jgi:hypothetical protein